MTWKVHVAAVTATVAASARDGEEEILCNHLKVTCYITKTLLTRQCFPS